MEETVRTIEVVTAIFLACQTIGNVIKFTEVYLPALLHASLVIEEKFDSNDPSRKPEHPDKMKDLNWSKMKDYFIIMSIKNEDMVAFEDCSRV